MSLFAYYSNIRISDEKYIHRYIDQKTIIDETFDFATTIYLTCTSLTTEKMNSIFTKIKNKKISLLISLSIISCNLKS